MLARIAAAIPVLVIALAAVAGPQGLAFRCMMGGEARSTCCCSHGNGGGEGGMQASVDPRPDELRATRMSCCEVQAPRWEQTPPALEAPRNTDSVAAAPALLAYFTVVATPRGHAIALPTGARAPPPRAAPLYVTHCAYLI